MSGRYNLRSRAKRSLVDAEPEPEQQQQQRVKRRRVVKGSEAVPVTVAEEARREEDEEEEEEGEAAGSISSSPKELSREEVRRRLFADRRSPTPPASAVQADTGNEEPSPTSELHQPAPAPAPAPAPDVPLEAQFHITAAQRAWYLAQRARHAAATPSLPTFLGSVRANMKTAVADYATSLNIPHDYAVNLPWNSPLPSALHELFAVLAEGLPAPAPPPAEHEDQQEATATENDRPRWRLSANMLELLSPGTQRQFTWRELVEALLGAAVTSWCLCEEPLEDDEWQRGLGWAAGETMAVMFTREAREFHLQQIAVRVLEEGQREEVLQRKGHRLARQFMIVVGALVGKELEGVRELATGEEEEFVSVQAEERDGGVSSQQRFLNTLAEISASATWLRLQLAKPGNAAYQFDFAKHLDLVQRHGEDTETRVVFGVLPRIVKRSWESMIEPSDDRNTTAERLYSGRAYIREDWWLQTSK